MKYVIIGGASSYTPGIMASMFKNQNILKMEKIVLMDEDAKKVKIMKEYLEIYFKDNGNKSVKIEHSTNLREAAKNADFCLIQIRAGGLEMREKDEKIPLKYGVIGQETCGPGGMAFAMREIGPMQEIVETVSEVSPKAWMINYSNPIGIVPQAINELVPNAKILWICDQPISDKLTLTNPVNKKPEDYIWSYFGINHFGFFSKAINKETGENELPKMRQLLLEDKVDFSMHDAERIKQYGSLKNHIKLFSKYIPNSYVKYYFFSPESVSKLNANYTRANEVMDTRRKDVFELAQKIIAKKSSIGVSQKIGIHGEFIINQVKSIILNDKKEYMANMANNGMIKDLPKDAVVEGCSTMTKNGPKWTEKHDLPLFYLTILQQQKAYETLVIKAWKEKSYESALMALTLNRTVPSANIAKKILDDFIVANKGYWPILK